MDFESISARISKCEEDIKILYSRTNKAEVNQARITEKLDNVLVELGRVRESIASLKGKPGKRWESLIMAIIAALAGAFIAYILK